MVHSIQAALAAWTLPVSLVLVLILDALVYLRGWTRLRLSRVNIIPAWRAASYLLGLFLIWLAVGSPLSEFDEQLLTVHMAQHLLLMTLAPALILLGAPIMPLLHGLPRHLPRAGHDKQELELAGPSKWRLGCCASRGDCSARGGLGSKRHGSFAFRRQSSHCCADFRPGPSNSKYHEYRCGRSEQ